MRGALILEQTDTGTSRVFIVHFVEENAAAVERLLKEFPHSHELSPTLYLIRTTKLASSVSNAVGIKGEGRLINGVVFRLNHIYSGYYKKDLWDWLANE